MKAPTSGGPIWRQMAANGARWSVVAAMTSVLTLVSGGEISSKEHVTRPKPTVQDGKLPSDVVEGLQDVYSIHAKLRFNAKLFGKNWSGEGRYLEVRSGPIPKSRLEIESGLTGTKNRLLQICDGKTVWLHDGIENADRVVVVDASRCSEAAEAIQTGPLDTSLSLGGIAGLLQKLEATFYFDPPTAATGQQDATRLVVGTLRKDVALRFIEKNPSEEPRNGQSAKTERAEWNRLPAQMPTHITLAFRRNSPIPASIAYHRLPPDSKQTTCLLQLEFDKTTTNQKIPEKEFTFTLPEGAEVIDQTDEVLSTLQ